MGATGPTWRSCGWAPRPKRCPACSTKPPAAGLGNQAFLERLLAVEVDAVDERRRASLTRFASLPSPFTLADFDYSAQPSVDPKLIAELATLRFVDDATNVLLIGPPGVGKTMLAVGLGHAAVAAGMRTYYTTAAELAATLPPRRPRGTLGDHDALLRRTAPAHR